MLEGMIGGWRGWLRGGLAGVALVALGAMGGCASSSAAIRAADRAQLSVEDAERIIAAYEARQTPPATADARLRSPSTLDDLEAILRRDEVSLFAVGVEWAKAHPSPKVDVLRAQIELAWGEALEQLATLLDRARRDLDAEYHALEHKGAVRALTEQERTRRERLVGLHRELEEIEAALRARAIGHLDQGAALVRTLLGSRPDDYRSYRVAADYHRLREEWSQFDTMMKELEARHPQSNGALFLRGAEAIERYGDRDGARKQFEAALAKDPQFTRAAVQLLLADDSPEGAYRELQRIQQVSPSHQIVRWLGPAITAQYNSFAAARQRREQRAKEFALPAQ
jgi:hypothetical protein